MEFEAGTYYVGDLCYILSDVWDEVCDHWGDDVFTLKDGRKVAMLSTMYGDGGYEDQFGNNYDVDSGTIGCVKVDGLPEGSWGNNNAMIVKFDNPFNVDASNGVICIGHIHIDTGD